MLKEEAGSRLEALLLNGLATSGDDMPLSQQFWLN